MTPEELESTLEAMGRLPAPVLDEATIARIESRWRSGQVSAQAASVIALHERRRRRLLWSGLAVTTAAAVAAGALVLADDDREPREVVVAAAEDIVIVLPDGQYVDPEPGEVLPEGSYVQAGPYASGRIGDNDVRPDDLFLVTSSGLEPADVEQFAAATPSSSLIVAPPGQERAQADTTEPPEPSSSRAPRSTSPATTPAPEPTSPPPAATTAPASTGPAEGETTTPGPEPSTATTAARAAENLVVSTSLDGANVVLNWKTFTGEGFRRYVVYRVKSWDGASRPARGRLAVISQRSVSGYTDSEPAKGTTYVVVVIGAAGRIVAIGGAKSPFQGEAAPVSTVEQSPVRTIEPDS